MIEEAKLYVAKRGIVRKEPIYSANRFAKLLGDVPIAAVTAEMIERFRSEMVQRKFSPRTIESAVSDVATVFRFFAGHEIQRGRRLVLNAPTPKVLQLTLIDALWPHCDPWLQSWIAVSYWTALRMSDCLRLLLSHKTCKLPSVVWLEASKTKKRHAYPIPDWLAQKVAADPWKFRSTSDFAKRQIRAGLHRACVANGFDIVHPKQFRQTGITEWSRANATAGRLIHGCGIGVLSHYIDPLSVLESAAPRVRLPSCFGATVNTGEEALLTSFRRLDPEAQKLVTGMSERLVG